MTKAVYLDKKKSVMVERGHPWVFPKAINKSVGSIKTGDLLEVFDADGARLGVGVYNEHSLYRVRILAYSFEKFDYSSITNIIKHRLHQAQRIRYHLNLPNARTNAFRLFNSEGDGLSGLTIDCFNNTYVIASSAYWVEAHKEIICQNVNAIFAPEKIIWLPQAKPLAQDGWKNLNLQEVKDKIEVCEEGVLYQLDFSTIQKTGLFLDQRENHQRIGALSVGKRVLDLYTYTGGFALHAALAGAISVTAVDSSATAITAGKINAKLNHINNIEFIEADARDYLNQAGNYDLIILDPPKLVPSQRHLSTAKNYYRFLHREVFKTMNPGSLILTCNCSSALSTEMFTELVCGQAKAVGKIARILGVYGPASCHPMLAAFPEGRYLTAVLLAIA